MYVSQIIVFLIFALLKWISCGLINSVIKLWVYRQRRFPLQIHNNASDYKEYHKFNLLFVSSL